MKTIIRAIASLLLLAFLTATTAMAIADSRHNLCSGMKINIHTPQGSAQFVSQAEVAHELDSLPYTAKGMPLSQINTYALRQRLMEIDKIENATIITHTDGTIIIDITPIVPVARIFDSKGTSYYINRQGKHVKATARYHCDVPIIHADFDPTDTTFTPQSILPLINTLAADSVWNTLFTMIEAKSPADIILIPRFREHVVNFGTTADATDKLARLRTFYTKVLPVKGWDLYDTITLKWKGQIVATRRHKEMPQSPLLTDDDDDETPDTGTMLTADGTAPGQAIPGHAAHSEQPIPKANPTDTLTTP